MKNPQQEKEKEKHLKRPEVAQKDGRDPEPQKKYQRKEPEGRWPQKQLMGDKGKGSHQYISQASGQQDRR
jgi:hypothetical protein